MKKLSVYILAACFTAAAYVSSGFTQDARQFYDEGLRLKEAGDFKAAIKAFQNATGRDRKFVDAYYQICLCYMERNYSPTNLKRAETAIIKARRLDWDNETYLYTLGLVNEKRFFLGEAKRIYSRILEHDSTNIRVLGKIAEIRAREMEKLIHRVDVSDGKALYDKNLWKYYDDIYGGIFGNEYVDQKLRLSMHMAIEYSKFAEKEKESAVEINERILKIDPDCRDALFRLGILYFDENNLEKFIDLFLTILENDPADKDALLFLGLAYAEKGEHEISNEYYMGARGLMDSEELARFEDTRYIDSDFTEKPKQINRQYVSDPYVRFWKRKDPFFMTPFNERKLAHYGRVAEANLRFSVPRRKIPGWDTARGRIFIRYGKPLKIRDFHQIPDLINAGQMPKINLNGWDNWRKFLFWYYEDFTFVFNTSYSDEENKYKLGNFQGFDFFTLEKKIEKEFPDYYRYKPRGELVDMLVNPVSFRGGGGKTAVSFYYGIPINKIQTRQTGHEGAQGLLRHGIFIFNKQWYQIGSLIDTTDVFLPQKTVEKQPEDIFVVTNELELEPGIYNLGVEILDPVSGNTAAIRDTLRVEAFGQDSLEISDILLSHAVRIDSPEKEISRNSVTFFVSPAQKLKLRQSLYIYYEIYNLLLSPQQQKSRYRIDYSIYPTQKIEMNFKEFFKNLIGRGTKEEGQAISFMYDGTDRAENILQKIDLSVAKPGEYHLTLKVTDLNNGDTAIKSTLIQIFDPGTHE